VIGDAGVVVGLAPRSPAGRSIAPRTWLVLVLAAAGLAAIVVGLRLRR
jgi:hypothetical protein